MCKVNTLCRARRCSCASWASRLAAEGLGHLDVADGEDAVTVSNRGSGKLDDAKDANGRAQSEELAEEARDILRAYRFRTARDRAIFRLHVDGVGMQRIARDEGLTFHYVRTLVNDVTADWRRQQRQRPALTRRLVDDADRDVLRQLLPLLLGGK